MTADEMRAIVARFNAIEQGAVPAPADADGHIDCGALLALLREIAERVKPRAGLLTSTCPLCETTTGRGVPAPQRHLLDCPALVLEVLRG